MLSPALMPSARCAATYIGMEQDQRVTCGYLAPYDITTRANTSHSAPGIRVGEIAESMSEEEHGKQDGDDRAR